MTEQTGDYAAINARLKAAHKARLSDRQRAYLDVINRLDTLHQGWGGYNSTRVVRLLAEKGLIHLRQYPNGWEARSR